MRSRTDDLPEPDMNAVQRDDDPDPFQEQTELAKQAQSLASDVRLAGVLIWSSTS